MLALKGEESDSARVLAMRSECSCKRGTPGCDVYPELELIDIDPMKGLDLLGLPSSAPEGYPNEEFSAPADAGDNVSFTGCGGAKANPPKAGLIPVGDR
jgi:hypothetical protein